ncbi:MAG: NAD(P)/FAD-dependent oxidoreductase [Parvularcula sp.]
MKNHPPHFDVVVIGGGAAGLFAAAMAGQRGSSVKLIEHTDKLAEKVRISGGGRCNFTNLNTTAKAFHSQNPHFAKSALARFSPQDFLRLVKRHKIGWNEKAQGQLFCDDGSGAIIQMLLDENEKAKTEISHSTTVSAIEAIEAGYRVTTSSGIITTQNVIIATGGLSIPKIGASSFAYDIARRFGHEIVETRPALVPLTFSSPLLDEFSAMAGIAVPVSVRTDKASFDEAMLFTHRGLSGPAILQISSFWRPGEDVVVDLLKPLGGPAVLSSLRDEHGAKQFPAALRTLFPQKLAAFLTRHMDVPDGKMAEISKKALNRVTDHLSRWKLKPTGTEGYRTAEVTAGGISTAGLSSKTMESQNAPGLFFIGEAVDVTGWLGGYNFQWAWASAHAAAHAVKTP